MLDTFTKRRIDTARDILVGKVPDPKSQVEQITIALIYKFMDDMDAESEELGGKRKFFACDFARYGWAKLMRSGLGGHETLNVYAEAIAKMPENPSIPPLFRDIFKNAFLPYRDPETLRAFLKIIDEFEYDHSERLGDAFEYLLSVLGSQGDAGQFRTPRHIIDFIVAMEAAMDVTQPTIEQVGELLRRIPAALKRWPWEDKAKTQHRDVTTQRWDIQHEYHVQSLIWAVLRPVFPGLEDEENLPSVGHKHPRADLLVPALRLVIEVKYLREATQAARANVIEEIAADTAIYRTSNSGYDSIIAFIWDATRSNHHHAELEAGLRTLNGIVDIVIVSRPGDWKPGGSG